jgi:ATP-dependent DNA helicase RecG
VLRRLSAESSPLIQPTTRATFRLTADALVELGQAVRYHAALAGDFDEKVIAHLDEYGFITNQTLQRLFDLTVWSSRDALRDLRHRGVIVKLSTARSGPGIRYGRAGQVPIDPSSNLVGPTRPRSRRPGPST